MAHFTLKTDGSAACDALQVSAAGSDQTEFAEWAAAMGIDCSFSAAGVAEFSGRTAEPGQWLVKIGDSHMAFEAVEFARMYDPA